MPYKANSRTGVLHFGAKVVNSGFKLLSSDNSKE